MSPGVTEHPHGSRILCQEPLVGRNLLSEDLFCAMDFPKIVYLSFLSLYLSFSFSLSLSFFFANPPKTTLLAIALILLSQ